MAARGNAAHVRMAREHGATLRDRTPVEAIRPDDGEVEVDRRRRPYRCRRLVVTAGRLVQPRPRAGRDRAAAPGHQGAGDLLRLAQPGRLPARPVPGLDLDGRSLLLRLPGLRRAGPQGGAGRRRAGDVTADTRTFEPDQRGARPGGQASSSDTCPARWGRSSTPRPVSTPSRPTATSCSTCCPTTRRSRWRSAAGTASSSPR